MTVSSGHRLAAIVSFVSLSLSPFVVDRSLSAATLAKMELHLSTRHFWLALATTSNRIRNFCTLHRRYNPFLLPLPGLCHLPISLFILCNAYYLVIAAVVEPKIIGSIKLFLPLCALFLAISLSFFCRRLPIHCRSLQLSPYIFLPTLNNNTITVIINIYRAYNCKFAYNSIYKKLHNSPHTSLQYTRATIRYWYIPEFDSVSLVRLFALYLYLFPFLRVALLVAGCVRFEKKSMVIPGVGDVSLVRPVRPKCGWLDWAGWFAPRSRRSTKKKPLKWTRTTTLGRASRKKNNSVLARYTLYRVLAGPCRILSVLRSSASRKLCIFLICHLNCTRKREFVNFPYVVRFFFLVQLFSFASTFFGLCSKNANTQTPAVFDRNQNNIYFLTHIRRLFLLLWHERRV